MNETKPILAICYDFDKTLTPDDMQAQGYIQALGCEVAEFWKESNALASKNDMDQNLAYMYQMATKARGKVLFTRKTLADYGSKVALFPGVESWFERINLCGEQNGVAVEHYIISSGLKEMIEGTSIAGKFTKIYASSFYYDEHDVAVWPAQVVNYTSKTQYLFRIKKGVLDINDPKVNEFFKPNECRIPFSNMVYIGDSDTDIPCMKLVNANGGYSIGVYAPDSGDKTKVFKMLEDERIGFFVPAVYTEGSHLEQLIKDIIKKTKASTVLERKHYECVQEKENQAREQTEGERQKEHLINRLWESPNFVTTHAIIKELSRVDVWSEDQKRKLIRIAESNNQVSLILHDEDVHSFYSQLIQKDESPEAKVLREKLA